MCPGFEGEVVGFRCSIRRFCRAFYVRFILVNGEELFLGRNGLGEVKNSPKPEANRRKRGAAGKREKK
jgi:hypothetical protein